MGSCEYCARVRVVRACMWCARVRVVCACVRCARVVGSVCVCACVCLCVCGLISHGCMGTGAVALARREGCGALATAEIV